jgi:GNAT superfamily N-acetyltransferase
MSLSRPSPYEAPKAAAPAEGLPKLSTYTAETEDDRIDGLRLVADSVAQQRQVAGKMLVFHPVNLAIYGLVIAVLAHYMWKSPDDLLLLGTTTAGITMVYLAAVRMAVGGYLSLAEEINWNWLGDDKLVVVKWREEVIGSLVLGWADNSEGAKKRGTRRRRGKAVVRAWTVKLKYRGKGVGASLLEEAVKVAGERGADGIVFERDHANSKRILPSLYNGFLNKQEARAEKALEKVADEKGNFRQRRSSPTWGSR